nr:SGNH hydrolase domain-containing protein [Aestuariivirga litoralis]
MEGFPTRIPPDVDAIASAAQSRKSFGPYCFNGPDHVDAAMMKDCRLGVAGGNVDFLLLGDSFGAVLTNGVSMAAERRGKSGLFLGRHSCNPIPGAAEYMGGTDEACLRFQHALLGIVDTLKPKSVILHAFWHGPSNPNLARTYVADYEPLVLDMAKQMHQRGIKLYIVCCVLGSYPKVRVPETYAKMRYFGSYAELRPKVAQLEWRDRENIAIFDAVAKAEPLHLVKLTDALCGPKICDLLHDGNPMMSDDLHLSSFASESLTDFLAARMFSDQPQ